MSLEFLWTVPTSGGRGWNPAGVPRFNPSVRDERPGRFSYYDYLTQVARAAEAAGFGGLLVPYDPAGEDSWVAAIALAREAPRLRVVPEFQPGFATGVYTAKLAVTFQRYTADRLGWKLALRTDPATQTSVGDVVDPADRTRRAEELIEVTKGAWFDAPFNFKGKFFEAAETGFFQKSQDFRPGLGIAPRPYPKLYLDGTTDAEVELSAAHADVHLLDATADMRAAVDDLRGRAARRGRALAFGIRLGVIARETTGEAWTETERLRANERSTGRGLEAQRIEDHLYRGFDDLGFAVRAGLVGSFEDVVTALRRFAEAGVTTFVLEGVPSVEEAYRLGERVLPLVAGSVPAGPVSAGVA